MEVDSILIDKTGLGQAVHQVTEGHWLTVYRSRLPDSVQPPQMRVMTGDRPAGVILPDDLPNYPGFAPALLIKLLLVWAAMGFRRPKIGW